jgi:hypothetical protein
MQFPLVLNLPVSKRVESVKPLVHHVSQVTFLTILFLVVFLAGFPPLFNAANPLPPPTAPATTAKQIPVIAPVMEGVTLPETVIATPQLTADILIAALAQQPDKHL